MWSSPAIMHICLFIQEIYLFKKFSPWGNNQLENMKN